MSGLREALGFGSRPEGAAHALQAPEKASNIFNPLPFNISYSRNILNAIILTCDNA